MQPGTLYIVATPIGNPQDMTLRGMNALKSADRIICEERRIGSTLLKQLEIEKKALVELNEHNEEDLAPELVLSLVNGETLALISDCGTPAFADPGALLVQYALDYGIKVVPLPGASSLMTLLSVTPVPLKEFYYAGFLPRKEEARRGKFNQLVRLRIPIVIMDTPYRLDRTLQDIQKYFGKKRIITIGLDLTTTREKILHKAVEEIHQELAGKKAEFILIVH